MLNRTLSANLNGLNLGTRTLATFAGLNIVGATLRLRPSYPHKRSQSMRDGDAKAMGDPSIAIRGSRSISPSSSSPFGATWPFVVEASPARSEVVEPAVAVVAPVEPAGRAARAARSQVLGDPRASACGWPKLTARAESNPDARSASGG